MRYSTDGRDWYIEIKDEEVKPVLLKIAKLSYKNGVESLSGICSNNDVELDSFLGYYENSNVIRGLYMDSLNGKDCNLTIERMDGTNTYKLISRDFESKYYGLRKSYDIESAKDLLGALSEEWEKQKVEELIGAHLSSDGDKRLEDRL